MGPLRTAVVIALVLASMCIPAAACPHQDHVSAPCDSMQNPTVDETRQHTTHRLKARMNLGGSSSGSAGDNDQPGGSSDQSGRPYKTGSRPTIVKPGKKAAAIAARRARAAKETEDALAARRAARAGASLSQPPVPFPPAPQFVQATTAVRGPTSAEKRASLKESRRAESGRQLTGYLASKRAARGSGSLSQLSVPEISAQSSPSLLPPLAPVLWVPPPSGPPSPGLVAMANTLLAKTPSPPRSVQRSRSPSPAPSSPGVSGFPSARFFPTSQPPAPGDSFFRKGPRP